jgi:hypothetical protein
MGCAQFDLMYLEPASNFLPQAHESCVPLRLVLSLLMFNGTHTRGKIWASPHV